MNRRDAAYFAGECALLLFLPPAVIGIYLVWKSGSAILTDYSVAIGIPASACIGVIVAGILVPSLVAPMKMRFPLNLTLPVVYLPMMLAAFVVWTTNRGSIQATPERLQPAYMWSSLTLLAIVFVSQIVLLTLVAAANRGEGEDPTSPAS